MREFKETEKLESEHSILKNNLDKVEDIRTLDEIRDLKISDLLNDFKEKLESKENLQERNLVNVLDTFTPEKFNNFTENNKNFENKVKRIDDRLLKTDTLYGEEKEAFNKKTIDEVRKYKGATLELLVKDSLESSFKEIENTQRKVETLNGETKPDIVAREAQDNFKIGDVLIKAGEDVYIECKIGESSYLSNQFSDKHIYKQLQGHHDDAKESSSEYKSILLVSSDFKELPKEKQQEYSEAVSKIGSQLVVLESSAQDMDKMMFERFLGGE